MANNHSPKSPRIILVIGNAGIKSLAALPIIQFLQSEKIPIDLIIGSGGGAALAAFISCGHSYDEIPALMSSLYDRKKIVKLNYKTLLDLAGVPFGSFRPSNAILKNGGIIKNVNEVFEEKKLEETTPPIWMQATNLFTGEGEILKKGAIADAICASNAFYPFLPPVQIGDDWFVDGIYSSALPLLEATKEGPKMVIAIDFSRSHQALPFGLIEYYANSLNRTYGTMHTSQSSMAMMLQDIEISLIKVSFPNPINLWDSDRNEEILDSGRKALEIHSEELLISYRRAVCD